MSIVAATVHVPDDDRDVYGVEPICAVLPIAPSTYFGTKPSSGIQCGVRPRAQRDDVLRPIIHRIWHENHQVYGRRKVSRHMGREKLRAARGRIRRG